MFYFAIDWQWTIEKGLNPKLHLNAWPQAVLAVCVAIFLVVWFLPLGMWRFGIHRDQSDKEVKGVTREVRRSSFSMEDNESARDDVPSVLDVHDLDFARALTLHDSVNSEHHFVRHLVHCDVRKYLPDPTRREFGVLKLN